jgi:hypothetical protein
MTKASTRKCQKRVATAATRAVKKLRVGSTISGIRITRAMKARYLRAVKPVTKKAAALCAMTPSAAKKAAKKIFSTYVSRV